MPRPRLLDLYCGAGGAAAGYHAAGFDVVGVDVAPQPRYPYPFHQGDALDFLRAHWRDFDAIHASPPCQAHTAMKTLHNAKEHADLIAPTRLLLLATGKPYALENVPGAPLEQPTTLCGTMFGLGAAGAELRRHRLFETSFPTLRPACRHDDRPVLGVYGGHVRDRRRRAEGANLERGLDRFTAGDARAAMGIDWMTLTELSQALPPAYTHFIGHCLLAALERRP